jgi:hypothetical protein
MAPGSYFYPSRFTGVVLARAAVDVAIARLLPHPSRLVNRPGVSGDSDPWEGLGSSRVGERVEEVSA